MQYCEIKLKPNRYMMLAWAVSYGSLIVVISYLPAGMWQQLGWIITCVIASYSLIVRVLMLAPSIPNKLECTVDDYGHVKLALDNLPIDRWSFVWCTQRLVVLVILNRNVLTSWLPRYVFWFSIHNTSKDLHRQIRIIARFGYQIPLLYQSDKHKPIEDTQTMQTKISKNE